MAPQNTWQLGVPYTFNFQGAGPVFWSQPGGPGTAVYPQEQVNNLWPEWPGAAVMTINEVGTLGLSAGCGHRFDAYKVLQEYDYTQNEPCQLLVCPLCSYVQREVTGQTKNGMPLLYSADLYTVIVG